MLKLKNTAPVMNKLTASERANLRGEAVVKLGGVDEPIGQGHFHLVSRPKQMVVALDAAGHVDTVKASDEQDAPDIDPTFSVAHLSADGTDTLTVELSAKVKRRFAVEKGDSGNAEFELPLEVVDPQEGETEVHCDAKVVLPHPHRWFADDAEVESESVSVTASKDGESGKWKLTIPRADMPRTVEVEIPIKVATLVADDKNVGGKLSFAAGDFYMDAVVPMGHMPGAKADRSVLTVRGANDHFAQCWKRLGDWSPVYVGKDPDTNSNTEPTPEPEP